MRIKMQFDHERKMVEKQLIIYVKIPFRKKNHGFE